ncbi:hypothetical protein OS493_010989 [Desmophyllum pertusum]|uniref:Ion transport domain-containing protein n=1 Tax=Desmophyllum pertusum TaxID=174260 RepID=A0A9W9ZGW9_9CNID|nr:hypothetical protein OS493_010989 [Desmophyllum pertusum]
MAATAVDLLAYGKSNFRKVLEVWVITMTLWFIVDEISELKREPLVYIKDVFNYFDLSGYALILATFIFRYLGSDAEWTFASLAIMINFIGIFKYSVGERTLRNDIPQCTSTGVGCVMLAGIMTWLEGTSIVRKLSDVGWLGALLTMLFMMSVTIILTNILIAQLSLTYELVQEESLHSFTALRMQAVAIIEWQSRFKFWNLRKKYYVPGELKTRVEIEGSNFLRYKAGL